MPSAASLDRHFPRYTDFAPLVPIWSVTPHEGRALHRFFDTSPISPSGRFLAVFRLPQERREPVPGEVGCVCLIDLETGEDRVVAETRGWETQMGANINWGPDDGQLIFNDVDPKTWQAFAVNCDTRTGSKRRLGGPVYHVSPHGLWACGSNPTTMRRTQPGYGVVIPDERVPRYVGLRDDDGLWLTNTQSGESKVILSIKDAVTKCTPPFEIDDPRRYEIYGFHSKFNPPGDRLIFSIRFFVNEDRPIWYAMRNSKLYYTVLTCGLDGSELCNAVPTSRWLKHGHHINWFPDGRRLSMNLTLTDTLQFVQCNMDGSDLRPMRTDVLGSGHPTVHPDGRHILTDSYVREKVAFGDGTTPLRWVNLATGTEKLLARIPSDTGAAGGPLRLDPHPAWDRTWQWVTFNAFVDGTRRVFVMDMTRPPE